MRRWFFVGLALLALLWMSWDLIFSDHGYWVYHSEKQNLESMREELETLKMQRESLAKEILRMRNDPKALEELVHRELGYVYPDEYMLIMPGNEKNGAGVRGESRQ
jgi:cell division protein FtsB